MKQYLITRALYRIALCCIWASAGLLKSAAAQQNRDLAPKAFAVLEKHCAKCHGQDKTAGFTFRNYKLMLDNGHLVPGKPGESRLYVRAAASPGDPMPPTSENSPLNDAEKGILKAWIEAGAPQLSAAKPETRSRFLTEADVLGAIEADLTAAPPGDRPYLRYFTLTHLANAGASEEEVQAFRAGLSKLLNSLSWQRRIATPQPIDPEKTILRIDMRRFSWTERTWKRLLASYPYGVVSDTPAAKAISATTNCPLPYVRADWFVSRAALPPLYHDLLELPDTAAKLEAKLGVDIEKNLREETAIRAGLQESGVSRNNRVVERHESPYGAYWRSYDFRNNAGKENIFKNPLGFEAAGGEIIFNLPNGLQAYLLVNGKGERIDTGPIDIVNNKENTNDPVVRNGLTCMSCHAQGMKRFTDSLRAVLVAAPTTQIDYDANHALALYRDKATMDAALDEDARRFAEAVRLTGAELATREPIYALQGRYDATLDATLAAAELGLPADTFLSRLQANARLGALLGPLKTAGGRLKRDAWEEYFGAAVRELGLGTLLPPQQSQAQVPPVPPKEAPNAPAPRPDFADKFLAFVNANGRFVSGMGGGKRQHTLTASMPDSRTLIFTNTTVSLAPGSSGIPTSYRYVIPLAKIAEITPVGNMAGGVVFSWEVWMKSREECIEVIISEPGRVLTDDMNVLAGLAFASKEQTFQAAALLEKLVGSVRNGTK